MKATLFIPREIRVGYQERSGTYTGKLAYVIYYDHKKVLRKEVSWDSWRDNKIEPDTFKNEPTEGFVLNKKAGGYSSGWNHRQTYTRVFDPRGFEFEITIPNLMYILENANCIKGKGLEGEFVYGWDGTELTLIPVEAPDYKEMQAYADMLFTGTHFKGKDLIVGATYASKDGSECVYLGRFEYYPDGVVPIGKKAQKAYFFQRMGTTSKWETYLIVSSLKEKIISCTNEECAHNYAELMEKLETQQIYSPQDQSKFEFTKMSTEEIANAGNYKEVWMLYDGKYIPIYLSRGYHYVQLITSGLSRDVENEYRDIVYSVAPNSSSYSYYGNEGHKEKIIKIHEKYPFHSAKKFLKNGKPMEG